MHLRKKKSIGKKKVNESSQSALRLEVGRPKSCLHDRFQLARLRVQTPASGMRGMSHVPSPSWVLGTWHPPFRDGQANERGGKQGKDSGEPWVLPTR